MYGQVFFVFQQLDERAFQPGVDIPVELAEVIARHIVAVIGEFDAVAALDGAAVAFHGAHAHLAGDQHQRFEAATERLGQKGVSGSWLFGHIRLDSSSGTH